MIAVIALLAALLVHKRLVPNKNQSGATFAAVANVSAAGYGLRALSGAAPLPRPPAPRSPGPDYPRPDPAPGGPRAVGADRTGPRSE